MARKETAIEVKVGALVLLAIGILVAFVLILGDFSFKKGFVLYVDFDNAAGLKPGAPVRIAGIPAGSIQAVQFLGGEFDEALGRPVFVRATLRVDDENRESVRTDAQFTITTQGVLGEPYIEIMSVDRDAPIVEPGHTFRGIDPPRMDMILSSAYEGIEGLRELVERLNRRGENPIRIDDFINNIADLAHNIDERVVENKEEIDNIITNIDAIVAEIETEKQTLPEILRNVNSATARIDDIAEGVQRAVGDGSELRSIVRNVEEVSEVAAREAEPVLTEIRGAAESANRILTNNEENIEVSVANVREISDDLVGAADDAREIIARVERGEGNLGRLLQDEEIFEDMREFVRELKRRPWRIIWKE
jgi:phospholipid/cholesterol/gamma-HCH transport system substrate-binding protein